jgi:hypothetical protein
MQGEMPLISDRRLLPTTLTQNRLVDMVRLGVTSCGDCQYYGHNPPESGVIE